ncbi:MAG: aminotransferase class I/II-fold pyridoxal phosphate-dependent enzyme [Deltaproteobacteria bacterium]|nr:aminotransferase class I/II-fold pyridoxal phosphate-dependent enzyme [Deltaproteobacteria bacterium]
MSNGEPTVVIMAGGKGIRMRPFTEHVPKPLLPVGNKPIIEVVIDKLINEGFKRFIITLGYKGDMIKARIGNGRDRGVRISYTNEDKPLGTIGALTLIEEIPRDPFLVINGDVLTDQDLREILHHHVRTRALVTVGITRYGEHSRFGHIQRNGEILNEIEEKPLVYYEIGAGIYAMSPEVIKIIPNDCFFDFPDLINKIEERNRINCFEIKGFWKDIGRPQDYEEVNNDICLLKQLGCLPDGNMTPASPNDTGNIRIPMAMPSLSYEEARACFDVVLSTWVNEGQKVKEFENSICHYISCNHAVAFFNGTVALHALLVALGIGSGDEVIVPSLTFVSTATAVLHTGARAVFADIDEKTFDMAPLDMEKRITAKTKAVIVVHYGGQAADIDALLNICKKHRLFLIEDAAEAIGAEYKGRKVGSGGGIAAMFSFTPTKNITTGEGGMITTDDVHLADKLRLIKNHGSPEPYHHTILGYNYRMTEMQGAIGVEQVKKLPAILKQKRTIADYYQKILGAIPGIVPPYVPEYSLHSYMIFTIKINEEYPRSRDEVMQALYRKGIDSKIYFPPAHLQPFFRELYPHLSLPVCEKVSQSILSLPIYASLSHQEVDYIAAVLHELAQTKGPIS